MCYTRNSRDPIKEQGKFLTLCLKTDTYSSFIPREEPESLCKRSLGGLQNKSDVSVVPRSYWTSSHLRSFSMLLQQTGTSGDELSLI